jgi:hypothetical protein
VKLKTAAVIATTDDGHKIGGPYFLPLDEASRQELKQLAREYGPVSTEPKAPKS